MKFSFEVIKKFAPGKYSKSEFVGKFNLHVFETVDLGGDVLEIGITPNRFASAASHLGIAREASVVFNTKFIDPAEEKLKPDFKEKGMFGISVKEKNLCPRYSVTYVSDVKIGPSPKWLKNALEVCGLRSINNVVDIMNYVMLEIGQPLHAFDADKVSGGIIVRKAKQGEEIETIDNNKFKLDSGVLVIADEEVPLAIAGIKGGKHSEVSLKTTRLLVESANFDGVNIYKTSRKLNLRTDASNIFAHNLSPASVELGMARALALLKELCGAKIYKTEDIYLKKQPKKAIKLDIAKIEKIIGSKIKKSDAESILAKLGFVVSKKTVIVPPLRTDVEGIEDLAEEIARIIGFNELKALPPKVYLGTGDEDGGVVIKDKIKKYLCAAGYSEVYNYSFLPKEKIKLAPSEVLGIADAPEISNPVSADFSHLRNSLSPLLEKNLNDNLRFSGEVRIFEIGKVFGTMSSGNGGLKISEKPVLGIAIYAKEGFLELKGILDGLFGYLGLTDWFTPDLNLKNNLLESKAAVRIETGDHAVLGYAGVLKSGKNGAALELDLEKLVKEVMEEKEYEPLSKFPSIDRDISILVPRETQVGRILELIQGADVQHVDDVDLMDFYEDEKFEGKKSLTFRIVFQADDRTLTDGEVDKELEKIVRVLREEADVEIR